MEITNNYCLMFYHFIVDLHQYTFILDSNEYFIGISMFMNSFILSNIYIYISVHLILIEFCYLWEHDANYIDR